MNTTRFLYGDSTSAAEAWQQARPPLSLMSSRMENTPFFADGPG